VGWSLLYQDKPEDPRATRPAKPRALLSPCNSCRALAELGRVQVVFRYRVPILSWKVGYG
jgi:hypothetical protein